MSATELNAARLWLADLFEGDSEAIEAVWNAPSETVERLFYKFKGRAA